MLDDEVKKKKKKLFEKVRIKKKISMASYQVEADQQSQSSSLWPKSTRERREQEEEIEQALKIKGKKGNSLFERWYRCCIGVGCYIYREDGYL